METRLHTADNVDFEWCIVKVPLLVFAREKWWSVKALTPQTLWAFLGGTLFHKHNSEGWGADGGTWHAVLCMTRLWWRGWCSIASWPKSLLCVSMVFTKRPHLASHANTNKLAELGTTRQLWYSHYCPSLMRCGVHVAGIDTQELLMTEPWHSLPLPSNQAPTFISSHF